MRGAVATRGIPIPVQSWSRRKSRVLGSLLAAVLLVSACGPKTEIVYVDSRDHDEAGHGAYTPFSRSTSQRVHPDDHHQPAPDVQIGPAGDEHAAAYTPIAGAHAALVHPDGKHKVASRVAIANETKTLGTDSYSTAPGPAGQPAPSSSSSPPPSSTAAVAAAAKAATAKAQAAPQLAASPTPHGRLTPGSSPGETPGTPIAPPTVTLTDDDDDLTTVSGRIEDVNGRILTVETVSGKARIQVSDRVRVDRDALGTSADLKPGQFVGVQHLPSGPATSVRLYPVGPSMPRPGVIPMVGSRAGHITTFGSIVTLQFGGLLLNTGGQTTTVTLPGTVEILKPASSASNDLSPGLQIMATGPVAGDGTVVATGIRVTGQARPDRASP